LIRQIEGQTRFAAPGGIARPTITEFAKKFSLETKNTPMAWMQGANHALKHLQELGLKFFPQVSGPRR